jgi:putative transposase
MDGQYRRPIDPPIDPQSVKAAEESACIRGYDAYKRVKGRKRRLLVDTQGLPIFVYVTPADTQDSHGACRLLVGRNYRLPRLKNIWADAAYRGRELADWRMHQGDGWDLEVVERHPGTRGFTVQPRPWVIERSFAWSIRSRQLAKDYERRVHTSETLIEVAATRLAPVGWPGTQRIIVCTTERHPCPRHASEEPRVGRPVPHTL